MKSVAMLMAVLLTASLCTAQGQTAEKKSKHEKRKAEPGVTQEQFNQLREEMQAQIDALKQMLATRDSQLSTAQQGTAEAQSQAAAANPGLAPTAGSQPGLPGGRLSPELAANVCINNLRQMDGAKEQWALQNNKPAYTLVSVQDITPYLHSNNLPACPLGGAYTLNAVGVAPSCTVPGHALQK